jgi:hypothetical protein
VALSTYYAAKSRPLSARAERDAVMTPIVRALWEDNYRVYGARKIWKAARRAGHAVGRDLGRSADAHRVASHMRTTMVLDAIEMARWSRGTQLEGLRCHSDAGSQFTSIRYGERLAEIGAVPSIGTVGDSYDTPSKMMLVGVGSHAWPKLRLAVRRPDPALRLAASPANALICRPRRNLPCWNGSMVRRRRVTGSPTAAVPTITRRAVPLDVVVAAAED